MKKHMITFPEKCKEYFEFLIFMLFKNCEVEEISTIDKVEKNNSFIRNRPTVIRWLMGRNEFIKLKFNRKIK